MQVNICRVLFPVQNGLKEGDALSSLLSNVTLEGCGGKVQENYEESRSVEHVGFRSLIVVLIYHTRCEIVSTGLS
jgi:hypothetical protein